MNATTAAIERPGTGAETGPFDEGFTGPGRPRPAYARLLARLAGEPLAALAEAVQAEVDRAGFNFEGRRFPADPIPRILTAGEWAVLERGIAQRVRALNAFLRDAYGERRVVAAGALPAWVIEEAEHYEPLARELPVPPRAAVAGLDLVRDPAGEFRSLEDNLRTPSGLAFPIPARDAVLRNLGAGFEPVSVSGLIELLLEGLRAADPPSGSGEPSIALICDGPAGSAWFEHRDLAGRLGVPALTPAELYERRGRLRGWDGERSREIDVVYRRTAEERLTDHAGNPTALGSLLIDPLRRGTVACVNPFGAGLADDKLVHAYSADLIRFYLGEEPVLAPVRGYDLGRAEHRAEALGRVDELVFKGRGGSGGEEVLIADEAGSGALRATTAAVKRDPSAFVAQEKVTLSTHPTVAAGGLEPRHVDLRPFAFAAADEVAVLPGGFTRFAPERGQMIVNTAQGGGGKDTWVLAPADDGSMR